MPLKSQCYHQANKYSRQEGVPNRFDCCYKCAVFRLPEILGSDFHIFTQHDDFNRESSIPRTCIYCVVVGAIPTGCRASYWSFQGLMWLPSSLIPLFETDAYNQARLRLIPPGDVSGAPTLPSKNPSIFMGGSADYGPKSI